ncbi:MAG: DUF2029 domain-containing protein [Actinomycetota bacterium]|nr:DUF2029 domain-containing protein [Actinomycetota bacterium]
MASTHVRRLAVELAGRSLLVVVTVHLLPHIFVGDITHFRHIARLVTPSRLPYRSVLWEFPPLTIPFLLLEKISSGSRAVYLSLFAAVTVTLELASLELLRRAWPDRDKELTWIWMATVLPVAALAYFRLDFLAVFFAALALVGIERGRATAWPIVAGVATKLWPGLLLVVLAVQRRWRSAVAGLIGSIAVFVGWYAFSPKGFRAFVRYRAGKGLEIESLPASLRLLGHHGRFTVRSGAWVIDAGGFHWVDPAVSAALVVFTVALGWWAYRRAAVDAVALGGALVLGTMLFSRLLSAQYLVWLGPFVAVLWIRGRRSVGWLALIASWLTFVELLWFEHHLIRGSRVMGAVVLARNVVLVALLVDLVRSVRSVPQPREVNQG